MRALFYLNICKIKLPDARILVKSPFNLLSLRMFGKTLLTNISGVLVQMLPKKKISKTRTRTKRAHHAISAANYSLCTKCGNAKLPHAACDKCGYVNSKITLKLAKEETS